MKAPFIADIAAAWKRISPREQKLLGALALAALIVAPVKTYDWSQDAYSRNLEARSALDAARMAARKAGAGAGRSQRDEVRAWSWQVSSAPVGRVIVQDQVSVIAARAGLAPAEIKSSDKIERIGGVDFVRLDITAPFSWPSFTSFLSGLSATGKGFVVESLVLQDGDKPQVRLVMKMPVMVAEEPQA